MDGCLVQNTVNTFLETQYYIFHHDSNIIAATLGLETLLPSKQEHTTQSQYIGTMQTPT